MSSQNRSEPLTVGEQISRNWLTICAALLSAGIAWGVSQGQITALQQRDLEMQRQFDEAALETRRIRPDIEARLRAVETRFSAVLVEVQGLNTDIIELKQALKETNAQLSVVAGLLRTANGSIKP